MRDEEGVLPPYSIVVVGDLQSMAVYRIARGELEEQRSSTSISHLNFALVYLMIFLTYI
jgi:hypothetical protein